ncbi:MAG: alkane 1-monooxygenase [Candidatus Lernaella stagnicola]|nr:alkane 1-monooxygenase [Candidatus Lernaella stagnicola]
MQVLPFFLVYLLPLGVVVGYLLGGWCNFLTPFVTFVLIPVIDLFAGRNTYNPSADEEKIWNELLDFRVVTWLLVPIQTALLFWGASVVADGALRWHELAGFVFGIGTSGGVIGINVAHELVHKHDNWERFLGNWLLWLTSYMHWGLEHIAGHHAKVATPVDPATARLNESFYRFWPRTVLGSYRSAWRIESARLERKGHRVWGPRNRVLRDNLLIVLLIAALGLLWGWKAIVFFLVQSFVAFSLLEVVNYIEHYGLLRVRNEAGEFERVLPKHSWNASERATNYFLFNLQRHSDHHYKPARRYQILRHRDDAPQLPVGYGGMLVLALVPRLWFRVMNPRVPDEMKELHGREVAAGNLPA